ncbi:MAG: hypothetical protein IKD08_01765, partial [Alphaproteobacteria bacterium]|nr:hypothetical protein [Alphaproteobacteria bacterium]
GGNDMKAAKVAALLGVSAGIYSAQDATRAWGINGVWAENISNYGFTSLPTGVPVVTTTYDKEDEGLNEEQLKEFIENTSFEKLTAKEFCMDNDEVPEEERCIKKWKDDTCQELIVFCDAGAKCNDAYSRRCNQNCNDILTSYRAEGVLPASNTAFRLTGSNPGGESSKTKCYFTSTTGYNAVELIEACNGGNNEACSLANTYSLNTTCQKVIDAYKTLNQMPDNGVYRLGSSGTSTTCWFKSTTGYSTKEVIEKCNSGTTIACQIGRENKLNRTCAELQTSMKSYGSSPASGSFKLTLTSTTPTSYTCDMNQIPAWTRVLLSGTEGASYTAPYKGTYGLACAGGAGDTYINSSGGEGGIVSGSADFSSGTIFKIAIKKGGMGWMDSSWQSGGSGIGIYLGSSYALANLKIVAGGGGGARGDAGGSGWGGGGGNSGATHSFGLGFYANAQGIIGKEGGGNSGCPSYPGVPYGGAASGCLSSNDPGGGGGSGYCSLTICKASLPYGISQKLPYAKPSSGSMPHVPPEAAVYIIEIK